MLLDLIVIIGFLFMISMILVAHHSVLVEIKKILSRIESDFKAKP